jgi:multicomponent Na+:H+ antiporter subunit B
LKLVPYLLLALFCGLLIYASIGFPNRGDVQAVTNRPFSPAGTPNAPTHYILESKEEIDTDNMVTTILADYRGYDTLGEETVILTAGLICFLLLRKEKEKDRHDTK